MPVPSLQQLAVQKVRPSVHRVLGFQYQKRALQYTLKRKAWDPMRIELVPVWIDLFLALIESEPPVQKTRAVYTVYITRKIL